MKRFWMVIGSIALIAADGTAQRQPPIPLPVAKFSTGDDSAWNSPGFDDHAWKDMRTGEVWQVQGYPDYHGYAWYRIHVFIPSSLRTNAHWKDSLLVFLAHVNDVDETWLNGQRIGKTGYFPADPEGYISKWPAVRAYHVAITDPAIKWDQDNLIAVKDYDGGGTGGIFMGYPFLDMLERTDGLSLNMPGGDIEYLPSQQTSLPLSIHNKFNTAVDGYFSYRVFDEAAQKDIMTKQFPIRLNPFGEKKITISAPSRPGIVCSYIFTEKGTGLSISGSRAIPYILTPPPPSFPRINNAKVFGARPGSPFLFRIAATGRKPLSYRVSGLPAGLRLDKRTGLITGAITEKGEYRLSLTVTNSLGSARQDLRVEAGNALALTPPMGWNSWNCWGLSVSDEKVRSSARALLDKGLADHGWLYINIDDGWQDPQRGVDSAIVPNAKFPSMRDLGDWLHQNGLRFGVYSSPGPTTCGGFTGSWQHEQKDADTYAAWGVDYLKYDWCSYDRIAGTDSSLTTYMRPYQVMEKALRGEKRDILYSLCQYGMKNVWEWGAKVDGQTWRTTEDIDDSWESLSRIGFRQAALFAYAGPGHWNDPDMMIVGQVGWGEDLHPSKLTPDEQYTHVSLWSLLSAPLLIGCAIDKLDPFTLSLLTNDEVLAIDQDPLGRQAKQVIENDHFRIWIKELEDGSKAVGLFNRDTVYQNIKVSTADLDLRAGEIVRDAWREQDLGVLGAEIQARVPPHGVKLLVITAKRHASKKPRK